MSHESHGNRPPRYTVLPIAWGAFFVCIIMYAGIAELIIPSGSGHSSTSNGVFYFFLGLSVVEVLAIPFVKNYMSRVKWTPSATPDDEEMLQAKRQKFVTANIIAFAIAETPAIYGLIVAIQLNGSKNQFYTLLAISFFAMVLNYPGRTKWDTLGGTR